MTPVRLIDFISVMVLNKREDNNDQNSHNEDPQESNNFNYPRNFSNNPQKEYKASTLDWLGGQARI